MKNLILLFLTALSSFGASVQSWSYNPATFTLIQTNLIGTMQSLTVSNNLVVGPSATTGNVRVGGASSGVSITDDAAGGITFTGLGGTLESIKFALNVNNVITVSSGSGATVVNFSGLTLQQSGVSVAPSATTLTVAGTANEIESSAGAQDLSANRTWTLSLPAAIDLGGKTSFEVPNSAAPTVDAFGEIAGDNNLWASGRGAILSYDGTAATALIGVLVSDSPSDGQVPKFNSASGTITWEDDGGGGGISSADVRVYTSTGASTWTNQANSKTVHVILIGGGGGGGSARVDAAGDGNPACGGGGGAGGAFSRAVYTAALLGATETVTVGAGGGGGPSQTTDSSNGTAGTAGAATTFGAWLRAGGGGAGGGGTTATGTAGGVSTGELNGSAGGAASGTGGVGGTGGAGTSFAAAGGAAGGGVSSADVAAVGGAGGGGGGSVLPTALTGGAFGNGAPGGNGGSATANQPQGGAGGGGGGGNAAGNGHAGGNGGIYGAGGGGGGGTLNGNDSGAGGNGANGIAIVITLF